MVREGLLGQVKSNWHYIAKRWNLSNCSKSVETQFLVEIMHVVTCVIFMPSVHSAKERLSHIDIISMLQ